MVSLGGVAAEIARCLGQASPDRHEAFRWVAQFVADFDKASSEERGSMVADEPPPTGDRRWDALLAGVAEHVCYHHGLAVPAWSGEPGRFLEQWWFVSPYRAVHASALVATPAAFANRGVFVHVESLVSV